MKKGVKKETWVLKSTADHTHLSHIEVELRPDGLRYIKGSPIGDSTLMCNYELMEEKPDVMKKKEENIPSNADKTNDATSKTEEAAVVEEGK